MTLHDNIEFLIYDDDRVTSHNATDSVLEIPTFTDVGSIGEPVYAEVQLDTRHGWYLTQGRPDDSGRLRNDRGAILKQFTLCRLTIDKDGVEYTRWLEVGAILPDVNERGTSAKIELHGLERNLKDIIIPGHYWFSSYAEIIRDIVARYNRYKGIYQPQIILSSLPDNFSQQTVIPFRLASGVSVWEALRLLLDRMRLPINGGGLGDYISFYFDNTTTATTIRLFFTSQGARTQRIQTIQVGVEKQSRSLNRTLHPIKANTVIVRGAPSRGTLPNKLAEFESRSEYFQALPITEDSPPFTGLKKVMRGGQPVIASSSVSHQTEYQYTQAEDHSWAKLGLSLHGGSTPLHNDFTSPSYPDCNLVIRDDETWRDWCDDILNDGESPIRNEGIRYLLTGSLHSDFTPNMANRMVSLVDGEWVIQREPMLYDEIAVLNKGEIYKYLHSDAEPRITGYSFGGPIISRAGTGVLRWRKSTDIGIVPNDCFHYPRIAGSVRSLTRVPNGAPQTYLPAAYLAYSFTHNPVIRARIQALRERGVGEGDVGTYGLLNNGWWYTLFKTPNAEFRPPLLDLNNRNTASDDQTSYQVGTELGELTGLRFHIKLSIRFVGGSVNFLLMRGNIPMRCTIYDAESNVWIADFTLRFNGDEQDIKLAFNQFKIYRARTPIRTTTSLTNVLLPELRTLENINRRKIRMVLLQCMIGYDEHGRFVPWFWPTLNLLEHVATVLGTISYEGTVDNFGFIKEPIVVHRKNTPDTENRVIMSQVINRNSISNMVQLREIAKAEADLATHPMDNVTIRIPGNGAIRAESSIYIKDENIFTQNDNNSEGTLKYVVNRVNHHLHADKGFVTELNCYRRINR